MPSINGQVNDPKKYCWYPENKKAKVGSDGKQGSEKVTAPCGRQLKKGLCPKHGSDTWQDKRLHF